MYLPLMHELNDLPMRKSRSQLKREMTALQVIGVELVALGPEALRKAPLPPDLKQAVLEAKRTKKHEAKRRQLQFVGKLMREVELTEIKDFLLNYGNGKSKADRAFHQIELWRERLTDGDDTLLEELIDRFPRADRKRFRQLTLAARRERAKGQPPKQFRTLFRYLRELTTQG